MSYKPDWEKEYQLNNCEVCGFVQVTNLKTDKFGKMQYQLKVLIDEKVADEIVDDVKEALEMVQDDYGKVGRNYKMNIKPYERISDVISTKKDKNTKEETVELAPKGKLVLNLATNAQNGEYKVLFWDAKRQLVTEEKTIYSGSLVNVNFKLQTYTAGKEIGITTKLQGIQIIKNNNNFAKNPLSQCPFDEVEGADDLDDEFIEEECFTDDEEEI